MELYALFIVFIGFSCAQDEAPLRVSFVNLTTREVSVNDSLQFVCHINRDIMYALVNFVEIVRVSPVDNSEEILTQAAKRIGAEPAFYNVKISNTVENTIKLEFEIIKVRNIDEGHLICRVRPSEDNPDGEKAESKVGILILRPLDALYLKFDNYKAISVSPKDPIEVESGNHTVQCIAEGSNPAPVDVSLYLHGSEVKTQSNTVRMDTDVTKYRTTITGEVDLKVSSSNHDIECSAASQLKDSRAVKLPVKIQIYDPKIFCNDSKAYVGERYPVLTCVVDYEGLNIKGFRYELGDKDTVREGEQNSDFVQVEKQPVSDTQVKVLLKLYQAKEWHFNTEFYLVVEHADGHMTRETVRLHKVPGLQTEEESGKGPSGNSCGLLSASLAALVMSVWCTYQLIV